MNNLMNNLEINLKKTKKEIKEWILKNAVDSEGDIHLDNMDFGNRTIILSGIKALIIHNSYQEATQRIYNDNQKSKEINNYKQDADEIDNDLQYAKRILNNNQTIIKEPPHTHFWTCKCGDVVKKKNE